MFLRSLALLGVIQLCLVAPTLAASRDVRASEAKGRNSDSVARPTPPRRGFVLRQDLFDRADPNNVRSDWPSPPAQPGQF
jgi:hypothetical protein